MYAKLWAILLFVLAFASQLNGIQPHLTTQNPTTPDYGNLHIQSHCIQAIMGLKVDVPGQRTKYTIHYTNVTCGNETVTVKFDKLELNFTRGNKFFLESAKFEIMNMIYGFQNKSYFDTSFGQYYKCNNQPRIELKSENSSKAYLEFENLKLAITKTDSTDSPKFDKENVCKEDKGTSNIVPIVVGAVLTGMIVIVLIAYLIGRRNNKSGYESV